MGPPIVDPRGKGYWLCTSNEQVIANEAPTYADAARTANALSRALPIPNHCEAHSENTAGAKQIRALLRESNRHIGPHPLLGRSVQGELFVPGEYSPSEITAATRRIQDAPLLKDPTHTAFHHGGQIYFSYTTLHGKTRYRHAPAQHIAPGRYSLAQDGSELFELVIADTWQGPRPMPPERAARRTPDGGLILERLPYANPPFPDESRTLSGTRSISREDFLTAYQAATYVDDMAIYQMRLQQDVLETFDPGPLNPNNFL